MGEQKATAVSTEPLSILCQGLVGWQMKSLEPETDEGTLLGYIETRAEISSVRLCAADFGQVVITIDVAWLLIRFPGSKTWQSTGWLDELGIKAHPTRTIGIVVPGRSTVQRFSDESIRYTEPRGQEACFYPRSHPDCIDYASIAHNASRLVSLIRLGVRASQS